MWPHFVSLLHRSWDAFLRAEGTTGLAWIGDKIVLPIGAFFVALFLIWRYSGRPAMKEHWRKLTTNASVAALGVFLLWHGAIFARNVVVTVYDDHHSLVEQLNTLQHAPKSACPVCPSGPAGIKEALKITTKWAYLGVPDSTKTHSLAVIVATTNKRITLPDLHVVCDKEFQFMDVTVSGATMVSVYGHDNALTSKEANFELRSPAWSPDSPIVMTVATTDNLKRNCETIVR